MSKRVIIVGGGFAGLNAARALAGTPVEVILIDPRNHHTFQPLLYQVAMGVLSGSDIAQPLRTILRGAKNIQILLDEVVAIAPAPSTVQLKSGSVLHYDFLVVSSGATHSYFGNEAWAEYAPGLKTLDDAVEIRRRIMLAFERAERAQWETGRTEVISFVIIGGGPTGVELAGAIRDISGFILNRDFRSIDPATCRVILIEGAPRILAHYPEELSVRAHQQLADLGVEIHTHTRVTRITDHSVWIGDTEIPSTVTIWAAGVQVSSLAEFFPESRDKSGAVVVNEYLNPRGYSNVFVCGDLAHFEQDGMRVPGVAQPAIQMGRHAAKLIFADAFGARRSSFRYFDRGDMATVGRYRAVADLKWPLRTRLSGYPAWIAWLLVHLMFLSGFRNRARVFASWAWTFLLRSQGAGLVTTRHDKKRESA